MTVDERLQLLATITHENGEGIRDLLTTTAEHSKQLEIDGHQIKQLAMIAEESNAGTEKGFAELRERMAELIGVVMKHERRIERVEDES